MGFIQLMTLLVFPAILEVLQVIAVLSTRCCAEVATEPPSAVPGLSYPGLEQMAEQLFQEPREDTPKATYKATMRLAGWELLATVSPLFLFSNGQPGGEIHASLF